MSIPLTVLPRPIYGPPARLPQATIPPTLVERQALRQKVNAYVEAVKPVAPLSQEELRRHTDEALARHGIDGTYHGYAGVLLNNHVWREALAAVPFERRLLLLPKCLRVEDKCPAPFDEFGLLCKQCGLCTIQDLQAEAERLGYAVLVAEGSALVMALIQTGKIDAIVGVSCLSVLERAFPYMETAAIPGVAIPLLQDDCKDTNVDLDWVWDVIHLTSDDRTRRLDLDALRREVQSWFSPQALGAILAVAPDGRTDEIARDWLARAGKRWRPFLTVCTWKALQDDPEAPVPEALKRIAVAVECFHKASLVHDDIEDGDARRYGDAALHAEHGVPVALNVGDLLVGEGYRLLAECDAPAEIRARLVRIAAGGHRTLCLGQGAELIWARRPAPLATAEVIDIFRKKTAPAFEVALHLGAAFAGAGPDVMAALSRYSDALGIAYQVRDDIDDLGGTEAPDDVSSLRPSLPLALAHERARGDAKERLAAAWGRAAGVRAADVRELLAEMDAAERCRGLLEAYKEEAVRALAGLPNAGLKGLLRRVIGKVFTVEIQGWCGEFEARNAAGRAAGAADAR